MDEHGIVDIDRNMQSLPPKITLKNGMGRMHRRLHEARIRFRKFSMEKESSDFYRAKLMLYVPWRSEAEDLIADFETFAAHYFSREEEILANEIMFTQNVEFIDEAIRENALNGPPEHMWDEIAPATEHQNEQDQHEEVSVSTTMEQEDLDANAAMMGDDTTSGTDKLSERYQAEINKDLIPPEEYRRIIRGLNIKQRCLVFFHRRWCKNAVTALKEGKKIVPYHLFLSGPGGVGKSHLIRIIHSDTRKILSLSNEYSTNGSYSSFDCPDRCSCI